MAEHFSLCLSNSIAAVGCQFILLPCLSNQSMGGEDSIPIKISI
ncbi:hypothetical protein JCM19238_3300 [Vibrio ponticus]|nr:hypothetical protein JCM19238_3300 [Vibrio ponticus]